MKRKNSLSELQKRRMLSAMLRGRKQEIAEKSGLHLQTVNNWFCGLNSNIAVEDTIKEMIGCNEIVINVEVNSNS